MGEGRVWHGERYNGTRGFAVKKRSMSYDRTWTNGKCVGVLTGTLLKHRGTRDDGRVAQ